MCSNKKQVKEQSISYENCLNCGTQLKGVYCHKCGQHAISKTLTIGGFIKEYINNAFIWDPKCLHTIWTLISRPGRLTKEYLSGKYVSQEHPLKLNMFLLFVFVTLFLLFSGTEKMNNSVRDLTTHESMLSGVQMQMLTDNEEYFCKMKESPRDTVQIYAPLFLADKYPELIGNIGTIDDTKGKSLDKWIAVVPQMLIEDKIIVPDSNGCYIFNPEVQEGRDAIDLFNKVWEAMVNILTKYFPIIVLFTAPLLAISLRLVQYRSRLPRINHFIFALHYTAFLELLMLCIYILHLIFAPPVAVFEFIMSVGSCAYLTIAFHHAYNTGTWFKAILKALITSVTYLLISSVMFIGIIFVACILVALG